MVQTRKRGGEAVATEVVEQEPIAGRRSKRTKYDDKPREDVIEIQDDNESEDNAEEKGESKAAVDDTIDEWDIEKMAVPSIKEMLKERELSTNGDKKVLIKRLVARLHKEKDPEYKAKPKGRHCKWCGALMQKRRSLKGPFFGCSTWPECQYTTSLSGYAKPQREHLKGIPGVKHGYDSRYYERLYG